MPASDAWEDRTTTDAASMSQGRKSLRVENLSRGRTGDDQLDAVAKGAKFGDHLRARTFLASALTDGPRSS
jgi:hypothetical protein